MLRHSPERVEGKFSEVELRLYGVLGSSCRPRLTSKSVPIDYPLSRQEDPLLREPPTQGLSLGRTSRSTAWLPDVRGRRMRYDACRVLVCEDEGPGSGRRSTPPRSLVGVGKLLLDPRPGRGEEEEKGACHADQIR